MKKFEAPEIEITKFEIADVVTTSSVVETEPVATEGNWGGGRA